MTKTNYITASAVTQHCDDFADGSITDWLNKTGTWTATGGYMKGNSTTTNAKTTSPFGSFSTATINCDIRMNTGRTQRKARIIFAYTDASNYRFIEFDDVSNVVRWYDRISGTNTQRKSVSQSISSATWYSVKVVANGGTVSVTFGTTNLGSYTWGTTITGAVGCGYNTSNSDFDNFCVSSSVGSSNDWVEMGEGQADIGLPKAFTLDQNYPNPFNPTTTIYYRLTEPGEVNLVVYNILGETVRTLVTGAQPAGEFSVVWDSRDQNGQAVASGIYLYRLVVNGTQSITKKMVLMK